MPLYNFQNPYRNVEYLPPQPVSSVNDDVLFNAYIENAGLLPGYNFADFGNKYEVHRQMQHEHRQAQHVDPFQWEDLNPTNKLYPFGLAPIWNNERLQNYSYLNNPPMINGQVINPNYDYSSQRTTIPPGYLTAQEGYPTVSPVYVGLANSKTVLGTTTF